MYFKVANDAQDELFIATKCCVQAMYNVWFDKIYLEQITIPDELGLAFGFVTLGLAAPLCVTYREFKQVRIICLKTNYSYNRMFNLYR
jgi:hypothetical protein